jgi:hypothetical protein
MNWKGIVVNVGPVFTMLVSGHTFINFKLLLSDVLFKLQKQGALVCLVSKREQAGRSIHLRLVQIKKLEKHISSSG